MSSTPEKSIAHRHDMNHFGRASNPDGLVPWRDAEAPDIEKGRTVGELRSCGYCGSMHPADLAAAIKAGAHGHWADFKYGWPHKWYVEDIPNPHAGMPETRASSSSKSEQYPREVREPRYDERTGERVADRVYYTEEPRPAAAKTWGKFYTVHLQDATPEDRETIARAMGLNFTFSEDGQKVSWTQFAPPHPEAG